MAEWLRRQPAKLMGYARVGSNPTVVDFSWTRETVIRTFRVCSKTPKSQMSSARAGVRTSPDVLVLVCVGLLGFYENPPSP